jgi:hypothetical protein
MSLRVHGGTSGRSPGVVRLAAGFLTSDFNFNPFLAAKKMPISAFFMACFLLLSQHTLAQYYTANFIYNSGLPEVLPTSPALYHPAVRNSGAAQAVDPTTGKVYICMLN